MGLLVLESLSFSVLAQEKINLVEPNENEILVICNNAALEWKNIVMANEDLYEFGMLKQTKELQQLMFLRIYTHIIDRTLENESTRLTDEQLEKLASLRDKYDSIYIKRMAEVTYGKLTVGTSVYANMIGLSANLLDLHKDNFAHYKELIIRELELPEYIGMLKKNENYVCQDLSQDLNEELKIVEI